MVPSSSVPTECAVGAERHRHASGSGGGKVVPNSAQRRTKQHKGSSRSTAAAAAIASTAKTAVQQSALTPHFVATLRLVPATAGLDNLLLHAAVLLQAMHTDGMTGRGRTVEPIVCNSSPAANPCQPLTVICTTLPGASGFDSASSNSSPPAVHDRSKVPGVVACCGACSCVQWAANRRGQEGLSGGS